MPEKKDRIVFMDAGTLDYGDISFSSWKNLGAVKLYSSMPAGRIPAEVRHATMLVTNKWIVGEKELGRLPELRAVHVAATGVNNVDLAAARERGIAVTNVAGYSTETVVQCTLAFILALAGNLGPYDRTVRRRWPGSRFFTWPGFPVREVAGKTLSIVGYGAIGRRVAEVGRTLGMKVLVARIPGRRYAVSRIKRVSLQRAVQQADYLTVHCPLGPLTDDLIDGPLLRRMKPSAFLINMARGGIVNEKDLAAALRRGGLAGAAADVLSQEPPDRNHVLLKAPNFLLTPHTAWASLEARRRLIREVALNIKAFQAGRKRSRVI